LNETLAPGVSVDLRRARNIVLLLAFSVGLMQTGFGIIYPVFARRLSEFGAGVDALGLMITAYAIAQFALGPFAGSLADRIGRRPLVLLGLGAFAAANVGFLFAPSTAAFTAVRAVEGGLTAGLFPAAMAMVADIMPEEKRSQWIGILMGCSTAGFIFGPTLGGILYDAWGFSAPFVLSAVLAFAACLAAVFLLPETLARKADGPRPHGPAALASASPAAREAIWASLPRPLYLFVMLLLLDFISIFAFTFIEPQMVFHFYDNLGWATTSFGEVIGVYGLLMVITQTGFGRLGDRLGRRMPIRVGFWLLSGLYFGLAVSRSFPVVIAVSALSGIGDGLLVPAMSAYLLDITPERHRSRVMGIKGSAGSLAGVLGPLAVAGVSRIASAESIFFIAGLLTVLAALLALVALTGRSPSQVQHG